MNEVIPFLMILFFLFITISGVPIAISMILTSLVFVYIQFGNLADLAIPFSRLPIGFSFSLLAIFLFIQLGIIIDESKMGDYILNFLKIILRKVKGRTSIIMILTCAAFGPLTGSAVGTTTAVGSVLSPQMKKSGYSDSYSGTLLAYSGILGTLIPPSISGLVYAITVGLPVMGVWMATLGLALLYLVILLLWNIMFCSKRKYEIEISESTKKVPFSTILKSFVRALPALAIPISILGSIYSGIATPTEAGAVAVVIAVVLTLFYYREVNIKSFFYNITYKAAYQTAIIMFLICASFALSYVLTSTGSIRSIARSITSISDNTYVLLFLVEGLLIILGCFLDDTPIMILLAPLVSTILSPLGIHPYHLAGIFVFTCVVGLVTPPVGTVLYAASAVSKMDVSKSIKEIIIFLVPAIIVLLLATFFPEISLFFPKLLNMI